MKFLTNWGFLELCCLKICWVIMLWSLEFQEVKVYRSPRLSSWQYFFYTPLEWRKFSIKYIAIALWKYGFKQLKKSNFFLLIYLFIFWFMLRNSDKIIAIPTIVNLKYMVFVTFWQRMSFHCQNDLVYPIRNLYQMRPLYPTYFIPLRVWLRLFYDVANSTPLCNYNFLVSCLFFIWKVWSLCIHVWIYQPCAALRYQIQCFAGQSFVRK